MGFFKSLSRLINGPDEDDFPDRKSYVQAMLERKKSELGRVERNMTEMSRSGHANPNDLDRIANLSEEIRDYERELRTL